MTVKANIRLFHVSIMHFNFDVCLSFVNWGQILIVPLNLFIYFGLGQN